MSKNKGRGRGVEMKVERFELKVRVPTVAEFAAVFPQYGNIAEGRGKGLWALVMRPASFVACKVVTERLGLPAVAGIAAECSAAGGGRLSAVEKQFVGALVRVLMEANGFKKTGVKRSISEAGWSRGEVYRLGPEF